MKSLFSLSLCSLAAIAGCTQIEEPSRSESTTDFAQVGPIANTEESLAEWEAAQRKQTDFAALPPWSEVSGANPSALARLGNTTAVLLRGESKIAFYDDDGHRLHDIAAPKGAVRMRTIGDALLIAGANAILDYRRLGKRRIELPGALALSDVDRIPDGYVATDRLQDKLYVVHQSGEVLARFSTCRMPLVVQADGAAVKVACLLGHSVERIDLHTGARTSLIEHQAPIFDMVSRGSLTYVVGIEDAPLDRTIGSFGNVDSFVFVYRGKSRVAALNLSAHGIITPKRIRVDGSQLTIVGPGGASGIKLSFKDDALHVDDVFALSPGVSDIVQSPRGFIVANPLLDQVRGALRIDYTRPRAEVVIGEALFFTHLLAPAQKSEGALSRFTCETCHFEGYVDGRIHHTGRGDIRVTTRPLRGLFNNAPHFSRGLDASLAVMVDNEFRVAHQNTGVEPTGSRMSKDHPWLAELGYESLSPRQLRKSFMQFFTVFTHEENPRASTDASLKGQALFAKHCQGCHAPRLQTHGDDLAKGAWKEHLGKLVFARPGYEKTGVEPYVHQAGARPPSLRRLEEKWPYFTNGSAKSLREVLRGFGRTQERYFHAKAPVGSVRFTAQEQQALVAFLSIL